MATAQSALIAGQLKKMANPRKYSFAGYVILFITFGILGTWAYFAIIASAVVAPGVVSLESDRKVVQHLEGGIVQDILVREAAFVEQGDPLLVLDNIQINSEIRVLEQRRAASEALIARLVAEQAFDEEIEFSPDLLNAEDPYVKSAVQAQRNIFEDRRSIFLSQTEILEFRAEQLNSQAEGYEVQLAAVERRHTLRNELFERMRTGEERGVIESNRLSEMQDEVIQIEASIGTAMSDIAQVKAAAGEAQLNILKLKQEYSERANSELKTARSELSEINEKLTVAADQMRRTTILAPTTGKVQSLAVTTRGSVIRSGEILMEIVPSDETLLIDAKIAPVDVDNVRPGLETEVRFSAFKARLSKVVLGEVLSISTDVVTTQDPNEAPYYLARIKVPDENLTDEIREGLTAGMPADVVILTGERTVLQYMLDPLSEAIFKSLREE
ncbi:Type I secretion system membrane fusion protein PrsE (plasmid) [Sulfitobacter indolifex]|uniref:Membrane fusion protein (MFP) family protein n=1 Tax=Sulfitobacter indolifex HEL-45 TaxID=391624 RepID=A0ABM9X1W0_9RHOB|nr:HlyD family type I secretion periplasmic adaptor subunit [Sulfitobacter indolifex]EDQ03466.1 Type I secretion membrane fusion protein, HlyD [Sulfitobacter indolifex HEL-45]UOA20599.1 Type I secretion system membrane fusion protein PrsE [Sulfitobacter indolifex]UOA20832.1 Type I secretion system membrane fusion protein PrsE [Sulfitobacter indolifex]